MATFAKTTFNASSYATFRPTYPRALFDYIFRFHGSSPRARWNYAVDLGCGTGQATRELTSFQRVLGVDPSAGMVARAQQEAQAAEVGSEKQFTFEQGAAETLPFVADGSVDLLVAAQACHWFDYGRMWPEAARVLRPGGSFAFWIYSEFRLTHHPELTPLITEYAQGTLGPHWEQPGRAVLDGHLVAVPSPLDVVPGAFEDWQRVYFTGPHYPELTPARPVLLRRRTTWADLALYLQTWSALHTLHEQSPEAGDVSGELVRALKESAGGEEVELEWPLAMIMGRRL